MKSGRIKSSMVAALLFCLLAGSPAWAKQGSPPEAAASADQSRFKLTERSLDNLRQEGLPDEIVDKLEALKDREFNTEEEFLEAVRKEIGNDLTVSYRTQIVKHAVDDISEIQRITQMLEAQNRAIEALQA
ncbi:MAG: hypothetical protein ACE5MM_05625, partial [Nitrospiraceae bacterium]